MKNLGVILLLLISNTIWAQSLNSSSRQNLFNINKNNLALSGYDPVAYIEDHKAIEGMKAFSYTHLGVNYRFVSEAHKMKFIENPNKYEPQYGGWCAYAMGKDGSQVNVDPETFKIIDGKLYLFYNAFFNNTKEKWDKDESSLHKSADTNWHKYIQN